MTPQSSSSARGATYPYSNIRNESASSRSLSKSQISHDAEERGRDGTEHRKRSTTSSKDEGSMYSRMRNEFRPHREEDQHQYHRDRTDDRRDTPRGMHYSSPKENIDIDRPPLAHAKDVEPTLSASAGLQHLYEVQSGEVSVLKHQLGVALEEKQALADVNFTLKQQYEERSEELSAVRHDRQAALVERNEIHNAYEALVQRYEEQVKELNAMHHEREAAPGQKQKAEEDYAALRQQYEAQADGYKSLRNRYHSLKVTLEQRTLELQGTQRFLTTADTFSGSEVVDTLRKLNEEVQQTITFMAEWAVEKFMFKRPPQIERTRMSAALGMGFTQLLGTKKHSENPILVEMAFRAYLIYELYELASSWSTGQEEQSHNVYMDAIYQRIREAEGQAISGNWRALTRTYTACTSDPEFARTMDRTIVSGFTDILLAAGCTTSKLDITSALWSKFAEKIDHFVSLAGQVNKMIGAGVISEDFEVLVVHPDMAFDDKAMEDSYDDGDRMQGTEEHKETVLCATELGLMQRMGVGTGAGQNEKPSELIIMKPKVALVSVIDLIYQ
ncbi:hypothetical protein J3R82DRAFT_8452 [Butyriboletus roseoflavus]|nr:hypothetical protein J3R82DRAFT_8452 [Butyriboletus roseoflavus]